MGEELVVGRDDADSQLGGEIGLRGGDFDGEDGGLVREREASGGFVDAHGRWRRGLRRGGVERDGSSGGGKEWEDHTKEEGTHCSPPERNADCGALNGWVQ